MPEGKLFRVPGEQKRANPALRAAAARAWDVDSALGGGAERFGEIGRQVLNADTGPSSPASDRACCCP